jgi:hypothetical protein
VLETPGISSTVRNLKGELLPNAWESQAWPEILWQSYLNSGNSRDSQVWLAMLLLELQQCLSQSVTGWVSRSYRKDCMASIQVNVAATRKVESWLRKSTWTRIWLDSALLDRSKSTQVDSSRLQSTFCTARYFWGSSFICGGFAKNHGDVTYVTRVSRARVTVHQNSRNCLLCAVDDSANLWEILGVKPTWSHSSWLGSQPKLQHWLGLTGLKSAATSTSNDLESKLRQH